MTTEQMIAEMQARILKLEKKVYELPPSIYNPFLESMPNPITLLHTHDPNKVAAWKRVPDDMLEDIPDINKVMADADLKPLMRDWEVLEFRGYTRMQNGSFALNDEVAYCLFAADHLIEYGIPIHSVRRATDGQVFTVGDRVENETGEHGEISSFAINKDGGMQVEADCYFLPRLLLNVVKRSPLYISADGVDIYQGDYVYFLSPVSKAITQDRAYRRDDPTRHYSTRTAAETAYKNWLQSQRVLSLGDVLNKDAGELEELVKSRLV